MKFTLSWLKDHLDTKASVDEIATTLSAIGLEVESVEDPAESARRLHDRAHRRSQASIRTPTSCRSCRSRSPRAQPLMEVVCGAPNARAGMVSVFAPLGTYIPGSKITLEKKPVRGVVSNGMMCSARRARAFGRQRRHHRSAGRMGGQASAQRYIDVAGPQRSRHRSEADAEPARLHGRARHRARSRGGRPRHAEAGAEARTRSRQRSSAQSHQARLHAGDARMPVPSSPDATIKGVKNGPSPALAAERG